MEYGDALEHHGVKNQRWHVRRWQNPDGSLTPAGRIHYGVKKIRENRITSEYIKSRKASDRLKSRQFSDMKTKASARAAKNDERYQGKLLKYEKAQLRANRAVFFKDAKQRKADKAYSDLQNESVKKSKSDLRVKSIESKISGIEYSKLKADNKFNKLSAKYIEKYGQDSYDSLVKGFDSRYQNSNRLIRVKRKDGGTTLVDRNVLDKSDTKSLIRAYVNLGYTSRDIEKKLNVSPEEVVDAVDSVPKEYYNGGIGVGKIKANTMRPLVRHSSLS